MAAESDDVPRSTLAVPLLALIRPISAVSGEAASKSRNSPRASTRIAVSPSTPVDSPSTQHCAISEIPEVEMCALQALLRSEQFRRSSKMVRQM
jgi:hypothetical protein